MGTKLWLALRPALITAVMTFVGLFAPALLGWLQDLIDLVGQGTFTYPDVDPLGKAFLAAFGAAAAGLVNFVYRFVQQLAGWGVSPVYVTTTNAAEVPRSGQQLPPPPVNPNVP